MADCIINKGMARPCKVTGGAYEFYVANYPTGTTTPSQFLTFDGDGKVTDFTGTSTSVAGFYKYVPNKNSASYSEEYQVNVENGSYGFAKKAEGIFAEMSNEKQTTITGLMGADLLVVVKDKMNKYFVMGIDNGAYLGSGTAGTGKALADVNGYTLSFEEESGTASPEADGSKIVILG